MAKIKTEFEPESKPKEQKQISIDLDQIFNPNPKLVQTYEDAKATHIWFDKDSRPEYNNEKRIFAAAKASKKPVKHNIFALYRKQVGSGKEYCYFFDHMVAKDYFSNNVDHTRLIGRYDKPIITRERFFDPATLKTGNSEPSESQPSVESTETVHEYEFSKIRDQLVKWKEAGIIGDNAKYYVVVGSAKYSMPYTWDQWLNLSIADLELLGLYGKKFVGTMQLNDPKTLQVLRETIQNEIQKGILNPNQR